MLKIDGMKISRFFLISLTILALAAGAVAQKKMIKRSRVTVTYVKADFPVTDLESKNWDGASPVVIDKYWSGEKAPEGRRAEARMVWSDTALYVRFEAAQTEPLVMSDKPNLKTKTDKLWDRDVCEIFIAPDKDNRNKYYEFEIAPNGEWIDVGIEVLPHKRKSDWNYSSGMESAARIDQGKVMMAIKIEFDALGKTPKAGDVWLGNLLRCVGTDPGRGYLTWQPTKTKNPNFHVPDKFGELEFANSKPSFRHPQQ